MSIGLNNTSVTTVSTTSPPQESSNRLRIYIFVVLLVIIMIVSLLGNTIVVVIVTKKRRMQTFTNWMILNLSIADLWVALLSIPLEIPLELSNKWIYGKEFCSVFYPLQTSSVYGSVFTLVVLSFSRFWAITKPFKKQPNIFCAKALIGVIWVCSFVVVIPYMLVLKYNDEKKECYEDWKTDEQKRTYTTAIFVFQYLLPLTVISIAYLYIIYDLCYREKNESNTTKEKRLETKKVVKLLCVITFTFAVCILPYHIVGLCLEYGNAGNFKYIWEVTIACYLMLYINSAVNPIIYNIFNAKFRESFKELYKTFIVFICHHKESKEEVGFFSKRRQSYFPESRLSSRIHNYLNNNDDSSNCVDKHSFMLGAKNNLLTVECSNLMRGHKVDIKT